MPRNRSATGEKALRDRLRQIVRHFSQAEIARKVGTSRVNVSRYLRDRRIPAAFCSALVEKLGVNPSWLMIGEGTMFVADITAGTGRMAGDLLELVQAMESVAKMRLGALTGKHHMQVLRQLNDALARYEELKRSLNERSRPVFRRLLNEIREALLAWDVGKASQLREAARQVARLCDDEELHRVFDSRQGYIEARYGNNEAAIEYHRKAFVSGLTTEAEMTDQISLNAYNYANLLDRTGRLREGRKVCDAALALLGEESSGAVGYRMLVVKRGNFDNELGHLRDTLARVPDALAGIDEENRKRVCTTYVESQILSGAAGWEAAEAMPDFYGKPFVLLRFAQWLEDPKRLKRAIALLPSHPERGLNPELERQREVWVRALQGALESRDRRGIAAMKKLCGGDAADPLEGIFRLSVLAQVARLCGDVRSARKAMLDADRRLEGLPDRVTCWLWTRAAHYRNALLLPANPVRERAREFFRFHVARGYGLFRDLSASS